MRYLITMLSVLLFTASCSKSPPPAPATSNEPTPDAKDVVVETTESSPAEVAPVERDEPLQVGDVAPDFRLLDQNGVEHTLTELIRDGQVALVFYRSADW